MGVFLAGFFTVLGVIFVVFLICAVLVIVPMTICAFMDMEGWDMGWKATAVVFALCWLVIGIVFVAIFFYGGIFAQWWGPSWGVPK